MLKSYPFYITGVRPVQVRLCSFNHTVHKWGNVASTIHRPALISLADEGRYLFRFGGLKNPSAHHDKQSTVREIQTHDLPFLKQVVVSLFGWSYWL